MKGVPVRVTAFISAFFAPKCHAAWWFTSSSAPTPLQLELLERAAKVRQRLGRNPPPFLSSPEHAKQVSFFPSAYAMSDDKSTQQPTTEQQQQRGFCNWLIPGHLMVGQYPGQTPEVQGPTTQEVEQHIQTIVRDANASFLCSLQSELPAQDNDKAWEQTDGLVFLEPESLRRRFPHPFTWYAPLVRSAMKEQSAQQKDPRTPEFFHAPIEDLNVPESEEPMQELLLTLLNVLLDDQEQHGAIYLHCWGGRGRAGLVGSCLLSLIWPTLDATTILQGVQAGYESRLGHDRMSSVLSRSPQTESQRQYVRDFCKLYQHLYQQRQPKQKR